MAVGTPRRIVKTRVPVGKQPPGIGIRRFVRGDPALLNNPESRLTAMKTILVNENLSAARKLQLAERIILAAFQVNRFTKLGFINADVLRGQTIGLSQPKLYQQAVDNLIRKKKIIRNGSKEFRRLE